MFHAPTCFKSAFARAAAALLFCTLLTTPAVYGADLATQAFWVPASSLDSPDSVRRVITAAIAAGAPAIVAPAPAYHSGGADPFMDLLRQAHERQLLVYASIDVDRVALADEVPASRDHVYYQHPEWLMVPRSLAPELLALDVRSPEYVGRIARWTRANGIDGVYLSPLPDDAASFVTSMVTGILKRYPVDGVQLEAARYPRDDFDYGRRAIETFRQDVRRTITAVERAQVDSDETIDPFAYPNAFPDAWRRFRQTQLTRLIAQVRTAVTGTQPGLPIVAAVSGAADEDLRSHLQDWAAWMEQRLVDAVSLRSGTITTIVSDAKTVVSIAKAASGAGSR